MRTIVVGVDGSERSRDALALARCLAETRTQLVLVYAYAADRHLAGEGGAAYGRAVRADAEAALARLGGGIGTETIAIADRHPADALREIAARMEASLIVIGSTHRGRLQRVWPGGTGEHLLERACCPIAIAPRGFSEREHEQFRSVACGFDGSPESRLALAYAADLARGAGARLAILRATDGPELVRMSLVVDVLVVGSRGRGPLRGALLGSVSAHVVRSAACPVIVVPRTAARARARHATTLRARAGCGNATEALRQAPDGVRVRA